MEGTDMLDHGGYVGEEMADNNDKAGKVLNFVSDAVIGQVWENIVAGRAVIGAKIQIASQIISATEPNAPKLNTSNMPQST